MAAHRRLGMALLGQAMLGWSAFRFAWCCNAGTAALGPACSWKGRAPQRRHGPVLLGMTQRGRDALATQAARGGARLGLACSMQGPAKHRGRGLATRDIVLHGNAGQRRRGAACPGMSRLCAVLPRSAWLGAATQAGKRSAWHGFARLRFRADWHGNAGMARHGCEPKGVARQPQVWQRNAGGASRGPARYGRVTRGSAGGDGRRWVRLGPTRQRRRGWEWRATRARRGFAGSGAESRGPATQAWREKQLAEVGR